MNNVLKFVFFIALSCYVIPVYSIYSYPNITISHILFYTITGDQHNLAQLLAPYQTHINDPNYLQDIDTCHDLGHYNGTLLHLACLNGHLKCVKTLLSFGASIYVTDSGGNLPLHTASCNDAITCAELLLYYDPTMLATKNNLDNTPLHITAYYGSYHCANLFLNNNANIDEKNNANCTPLYFACHNYHPRCIELLLRHGANVSTKGLRDNTPLHLICYVGDTQLAYTLVAYGANVNSINIDDETPIMIARKYGHYSLAHFLESNESNKESITTTNNDQCGACKKKLVNDQLCFKLSCGHLFHLDCLRLYENEKCPEDGLQTNIEIDNPIICRKVIIFTKSSDK